MKDKGLRRLLIVPNIFMWLAFLGLLIWFIVDYKQIAANDRTLTYIILLIALFFVSVFGALRNWWWMKQGKM